MTHLAWRVRLFAVGAGLGLGGMFLEQPLLIWAAVAALAGGMLLRLRAGSSRGTTDSEDDPED